MFTYSQYLRMYNPLRSVRLNDVRGELFPWYIGLHQVVNTQAKVRIIKIKSLTYKRETKFIITC